MKYSPRLYILSINFCLSCGLFCILISLVLFSHYCPHLFDTAKNLNEILVTYVFLICMKIKSDFLDSQLHKTCLLNISPHYKRTQYSYFIFRKVFTSGRVLLSTTRLSILV